MMAYLFALFLGFLLGMLVHQLLLQIAYRRGIVEYKGIKND